MSLANMQKNILFFTLKISYNFYKTITILRKNHEKNSYFNNLMCI